MDGGHFSPHFSRRYVYHAVHMMFNADWEEWDEDEERSSKLVFIGKNLDGAALRARFHKCLATEANLLSAKAALRFQPDDRVRCRTRAVRTWRDGTVAELMVREEDMFPGFVAPYRVHLDDEDDTMLVKADEATILICGSV
jgi:hypothetical protein